MVAWAYDATYSIKAKRKTIYRLKSDSIKYPLHFWC